MVKNRDKSSKAKTKHGSGRQHSGGQAAVTGFDFQARLGAAIASTILGERDLSYVLPGVSGRGISIRLETDAPVDDILIEKNDGGFVFIQAKTSLTLSSNAGSPFAKAVDQIVRLYISAKNSPNGDGWKRPLSASKDYIVLAVGPSTSASVTQYLYSGLEKERAHGIGATESSEKARHAIELFQKHAVDAWKRAINKTPTHAELHEVCALTHIAKIEPNNLASLASEILRDVVEDLREVPTGYTALTAVITDAMKKSGGGDLAILRQALAQRLPIRSTPSYAKDVEALKKATSDNLKKLANYEQLEIGSQSSINIKRIIVNDVVTALKSNSILAIGEPGAGKSGVLSAVSKQLLEDSNPVVLLIVDQLSVQSLDGLDHAFGLSHKIIDVLRSWPGNRPGYLIIDALDAARGDITEQVFKTLIDEVMTTFSGEWKIFASIRTFDLRMGRRFAEVFKGTPPLQNHSNRDFSNVSHVEIPIWNDQELEEIIRHAPLIGQAIDRGGERFKRLVRVPFNMRLLANLLTGGANIQTFDAVKTRHDLLRIFWNYRVAPIGVPASVALGQLIEKLLNNYALSLPPSQLDPSTANTIQKLQKEGVLLQSDAGIGFRHHILFDFSISQYALLETTKEKRVQRFSKESELGILIAPSLIYWLDELWNSNVNRREFWQQITEVIGSGSSDPIVAVEVARIATDLVHTADDLSPLAQLCNDANSQGGEWARLSLNHIVGTVVTHEDNEIYMKAWAQFASTLNPRVGNLAWVLRVLINQLAGKVPPSSILAELGVATRNLFDALIENENKFKNLGVNAVDFLGKTYASDPKASRKYIEHILSDPWFRNYGHQQMFWLTLHIRNVAISDPEITITIFEKIFSEGFDSNVQTNIGNSTIVSLRSNAKQDFEMAYHNLQQAAPHIIRDNLPTGIQAILKGLEGERARNHSSSKDKIEKFVINGQTVIYDHDGSHYWAHDVSYEYGSSVTLIGALLNALKSDDEAYTKKAAQLIIKYNQLGLVWARLLMVGAERVDILGDLLFPIVSHPAFLFGDETRKDAIDFMANFYPKMDENKRSTFEKSALEYDFQSWPTPEEARQLFLSRLFSTIGASNLVTPEAMKFYKQEKLDERPRPNSRPIQMSSGWRTPDPHWWLENQGVKIEDPVNSSILKLTDDIKKYIGEPSNDREKIVNAEYTKHLIRKMHTLKERRDKALNKGLAPPIDVDVIASLADAIELLLKWGPKYFSGQAKDLLFFKSIIVEACKHPNPESDAGIEIFRKAPSWSSPSVRISGAKALMCYAYHSTQKDTEINSLVSKLIHDPHPAVRLQIVERLTVYWNNDRSFMWKLADDVLENEKNDGVLTYFLNPFLNNIWGADLTKTEKIIFSLYERYAESGTQALHEQLVGFISIVWIIEGSKRAKDRINKWIDCIGEYREELSKALFYSRANLILGYDKTSPSEKEKAIRVRTHELCRKIVGKCVEIINLKSSDTEMTDELSGAYRLLDDVGNGFYFSSGAFKDFHKEGLLSVAAKNQFFDDVIDILENLGRYGIPNTIYHLIELIGHLVECAPSRAFDLLAISILVGGKQYGFAYEGLGADAAVKLLGRFLSDHRDIFIDKARRKGLIDCLSLFLDNGWPAARQLFQRLPELLA